MEVARRRADTGTRMLQAAGFATAAAFVIDIIGAGPTLFDHADRWVSGTLLLLFGSLIAGGLTGLLTAVSLTISRHGNAAIRFVLLGLPIGGPLAWWAVLSLRGPAASELSSIWALRVGAVIAALIGAATLARLWSSPNPRKGFRIPCLVLAVAAMATDAVLLRGLYPSFHHGLRLIALATVAWVGFGVPARRGVAARVAGGFAVIACFVAPVLILSRTLPGEDLFSRRILLGASRTAGPILRPIVPAPRDHDASRISGAPLPIAAAPPEILDAVFEDRRRFNILWITVDTLRASRMSLYGYDRPTTPELEEFAQEAVVFERAYAQHPSSALSFVSMLTSRYPSALARRLGLPPKDVGPLMPEVVANRTTVAVTALQRGYVRKTLPYLEPGFPGLNTLGVATIPHAEAVLRSVVRRLDDLTTSPWFAWVHLFDPHKPYRPRPATSRLAATTRQDDDGTRYDGEVGYVDHQIGTFLRHLKRTQDWDRTVVVLCGDHGESLGEHGLRLHGSSLVEEQIHVPLIIRVPGAPARRVSDPVELVDIVPTIEEIVGVTPASPRQGHSLVGHLVPDEHRDAVARPDGIAYSQFIRDTDDFDAVITRRWKLVRDRKGAYVSLYDLANEGESRDLAYDQPDRRDALAREARGFAALADGRPVTPPAADPPRGAGARMERYARFQSGILASDPAAVVGLLALCRENMADTTGQTSLRLAALLAPDEARATLETACHHQSREVRSLAAKLLAFQRRSDVESSLRRLLGDGDADVRVSAAGALALIGSDAGRKTLEERSRLGSLERERWRVAGLAALGDESAIATVGSIVTAPDSSIESVRAAWASARHHPESCVAIDLYLRILLEADPPRVRHVLAAMLERDPIEVTAPLLRILLTEAGDHDSRALHERAARLLGSHAKRAARIEKALARFRALAATPTGAGALTALQEAVKTAQDAGIVDWGVHAEIRIMRHATEAPIPPVDTNTLTKPMRTVFERLLARDAGPRLQPGRFAPEFTAGVNHEVMVVRHATPAQGTMPGGLARWGGRITILDGAAGLAPGPHPRIHEFQIPAYGIGPGTPLRILYRRVAPAPNPRSDYKGQTIELINGRGETLGSVTR